jgi:hypothetical protein
MNREVHEKRLINTKTGIPRSLGKPRFPGAKATKKYN